MNDYLEPLVEMMSHYMQSVSEQRAAAYAKRLREFPLEHVKAACARGVESRDSMPSTAYLMAVCREIAAEERKRNADHTLGKLDWIDEILMAGRPWWDRRDDTLGRHHWSEDERRRWRAWMQARIAEGWTEQEVCQVVQGARPSDWTPEGEPNVELGTRRQGVVAFEQRLAKAAAARSPKARQEALEEAAGSLFESVDDAAAAPSDSEPQIPF